VRVDNASEEIVLVERRAVIWSLVGIWFVVGATMLAGCKTTKTNRKNGDETRDGGSTAGDVDHSPVTVLPDGRTVGADRAADADTSPPSGDTATAEPGDGSSGEDDASTGGEGPWVPEEGDFVLRDRETGSLWNIRGEAYAGPLKGETLEQVTSFTSFWFAWSVFYDGSEIWRHGADNIRNDTAPVETGEQCLVDCEKIEMGCPGKDCIPALDYAARSYAGSERPKSAEMVEPGDEGTGYLEDSDFVFGVEIDGEPRAYPHNIYWWHEIHNDRIGDREYAVSFCPLTGSGIVFDGQHDGGPIRFGVSGRLYNANLVMFDPQTGTFWSQMLGRGIKGERIGEHLERLPVVETTWERWKEMHPDTLVASSDTGYERNYNSYPYGDYRSNHDETFGAASHQSTYEAKDRVLGLPGETKEESLAFAFPEMDALEGDRNVIYESFGGEPVMVVYEAEHRMAIPYRTTVDGRELTFVGTTAE
jgi:hypothetical protein